MTTPLQRSDPAINEEENPSSTGAGGPSAGNASTPHKRTFRRPRHVLLIASGAVFGASALFYVWYVIAFGINALYWDAWNQAVMVATFLQGHGTVGLLWSQHNENRMFFPNLVVLASIPITHMSDRWLQMMGVALLLITAAAWLALLRKPLLSHPALLIPGGLLIFNTVQNESSLWGFQLAWWMIECCWVVGALLLEKPTSNWRFGGAIALGVIASYSSLQGLALWVGGCVILLSSGTSLRRRAIWVAATVVTTVGYFLGGYSYTQTEALSSHTLLHTIEPMVIFFFACVGDIIGNTTVNLVGRQSYSLVELCGFLMVTAYIFFFVRWLREGRPLNWTATALGLGAMCLAFDAVLPPGRSGFGIFQAISSRYTTYNLLLLATLLVLCFAWTSSVIQDRPAVVSRILPGILVLIAMCTCVAGYLSGMSSGVLAHQQRLTSVSVADHLATASAAQIDQSLYPSVPYVMQYAPELKKLHLSVFEHS